MINLVILFYVAGDIAESLSKSVYYHITFVPVWCPLILKCILYYLNLFFALTCILLTAHLAILIPICTLFNSFTM
jgi:hypothetical protein